MAKGTGARIRVPTAINLLFSLGWKTMLPDLKKIAQTSNFFIDIARRSLYVL